MSQFLAANTLNEKHSEIKTVKLSLPMTKSHTVGVKVQLHSFLASYYMELSVRFTPWPLYHLEIELPVPTDRRLGGLYSLSRELLDNILFLPEIESWFNDSPARSLITIVTALFGINR
jgi:hypothetical protein